MQSYLLMDRDESLTIEEYQLILMKDPSSKVFAPLAEAYRKMGLVQQALELCERGVDRNPKYVSGLVAYGKILIELENYKDAITQLKQAVQLKSDNVLANRLLGLSYQKMGHPELALKYFKTLLYLKPNDSYAEEFVSKWGFLETQKIEKDGNFLFSEAQNENQFLSFVDSLGVSGQHDLALQNIDLGSKKWPENKALIERKEIIQSSNKESQETIIRNIRINFYRQWLARLPHLRLKLQAKAKELVY